MHKGNRQTMNYIIQIGQNVRMYSHLFDDAKVKNYCIGFFQGKDVGNHTEVPEYIGKIS